VEWPLAVQRGAAAERRDRADAKATQMAGQSVITVWDGERRRLSVVVDRLPGARLGDRLFLSFPAQPAQIFADEIAVAATGVPL
jgi:hypothetical protein